jgi:hypothetical protein
LLFALIHQNYVKKVRKKPARKLCLNLQFFSDPSPKISCNFFYKKGSELLAARDLLTFNNVRDYGIVATINFSLIKHEAYVPFLKIYLVA